MNNKIAVVTGVSRLKGIGKAICLELATRKYDIFFTYWTEYDKTMPWGIDKKEPDQIQQELLALGIKCEKLELDLGEDHASARLFDSIQNSLGSPSVLINNATYSTATSIDTLEAKELDHHYRVNLRATTLLISEFVKRFEFKNNGRIINLTSGQSLGPMPNEIAYAITKGAIETLTKTLATEIAKKGITINAVNPGPNDTGWMNDELKANLIKEFPMNRIGKPSDTAKLIGFLCSEDAEWITGQIIHSEGGFKR